MAFGLRPYRHLTGGVIRLNQYPIASAYATDLFLGDPVRQISTGYINRSGATDADVLGPFLGVFYTASNGEFIYAQRWTASTVTLGSADAQALVVDDPYVTFLIQASAAVAFEDRGENADMVINAGSATTNLSGVTFNAGGLGTSTAQIRILGKQEVPGNDWGDADVILEVLINEHAFKQTAGI